MRPVRTPLVARLAAAAALSTALAPGRAWAQHPGQVVVHELDPKTGEGSTPIDTSVTYLNIGPMYSAVGGPVHASGWGFEGSVMHFPSGRLPSLGYGAFAQAQAYDWKYLRAAAGVQGSAGPAGVELGLGFRQGDGPDASTFSGHAAVFLSIGYLVVTARASPLFFAVPSNLPSYGFETAFSLSLKLPIAIHGTDPSGAVISVSERRW